MVFTYINEKKNYEGKTNDIKTLRFAEMEISQVIYTKISVAIEREKRFNLFVLYGDIKSRFFYYVLSALVSILVSRYGFQLGFFYTKLN